MNVTQKELDEYLFNLKRLNKSEHTIKNYRADLNKFIEWLKNEEKITLEKTNGETIGRYKEFLSSGGGVYQQSKPLQLWGWFQMAISRAIFKKNISRRLLFFQHPMSVSSRRRHLSSIKNFFQYLKEKNEDTSDRFAKNPVKSKIHAITLKESDVIPTAMMSRDEFIKIEEKTYRTNERLILYLLYFGGLRLSELCELKIHQFDFESKTLTFKRKGGYMHTLAFRNAGPIFKNLEFYLSSLQIDGEYLFKNKKGGPVSPRTMYNKIVKMIDRAIPTNLQKQRISPHSFRKACATELYMATKDLLFVRDYLNHKDAKVTQTYIDKKTLMSDQQNGNMPHASSYH